MAEKTTNNGRMIFAHVMYRHGARNIDKPLYPNDPWADEKHWPEGYGQLTVEGMREQYELGQYFRRRYGHFLKQSKPWTRVHIQSTETDRTIMSAQLNAAGLFPVIADEDRWHKEVNWQPTPVRTIPMQQDYVLWVVVDCPQYKTLKVEYEKSHETICALNKKNEAKYAYWSDQLGSKISSIHEAFHLYNTLDIERSQGKKLPEWAEEEMDPDGNLAELANFQLSMATGTREMARYTSGFVIKEMLERMKAKIENKLRPDKDVWFYSAHDLTIASLLNALKMFKPHIPPFASSLHFELYETNDQKHYLQIFYRKNNEEVLTPMQIPNHGDRITLEDFATAYSDVIPTENMKVDNGSGQPICSLQ